MWNYGELVNRRRMLAMLGSLIPVAAVAQSSSEIPMLAQYKDYLIESPMFMCPLCQANLPSKLTGPPPCMEAEVNHYDGRYNTECPNYGRTWKVNVGQYLGTSGILR